MLSTLLLASTMTTASAQAASLLDFASTSTQGCDATWATECLNGVSTAGEVGAIHVVRNSAYGDGVVLSSSSVQPSILTVPMSLSSDPALAFDMSFAMASGSADVGFKLSFYDQYGQYLSSEMWTSTVSVLDFRFHNIVSVPSAASFASLSVRGADSASDPDVGIVIIVPRGGTLGDLEAEQCAYTPQELAACDAALACDPNECGSPSRQHAACSFPATEPCDPDIRCVCSDIQDPGELTGPSWL